MKSESNFTTDSKDGRGSPDLPDFDSIDPDGEAFSLTCQNGEETTEQNIMCAGMSENHSEMKHTLVRNYFDFLTMFLHLVWQRVTQCF